MGLKKGNGGKRCPVHGCSAVVVPRCGPCKGHLSTKSNAFCIDSARNLISQYLIRDHMVFHYNRILSAKAAVDCSVPKSRLTCIKLADQQRREKLKRKLAKYGEKLSVCEAVPQCCSRNNARLPQSTFRKSCMEVEENVFPCARAPSPHGRHCLVDSSPVRHVRRCSQNTFRMYHSNSNTCVSRPSKHCVFVHSRSTESVGSVGCSKGSPGNNPRASAGDLLERHSECFTKVQKPFTPRTLISDAKSSLSEYRYYTCARRKKKNHHSHCVEAQTQTDVISFPSGDKVYVRKVTSEQKITSKAEDKGCTCDEPEREMDGCQCSSLRCLIYSRREYLKRSFLCSWSLGHKSSLAFLFISRLLTGLLLGFYTNGLSQLQNSLFSCDKFHWEAN